MCGTESCILHGESQSNGSVVALRELNLTNPNPLYSDIRDANTYFSDR